ncbi:MAG: penicillin-binding transpeptidase domain-containing protein, partial [Gemmatimonadaceae bacterium]
GQDRCIAGWNKDLSLRQAYQESAFWVFQRFAHEVGAIRMRRWLQRAEYGNHDADGGIHRFWLDGALRISLLEQVEFLQRLQARQLPFSPRTIEAVQDVMVEARGVGYVLRGKTGWARQLTDAGDRFGDCRPAADRALGNPVTPEIGWYVGYVVRGERIVFFALNVDIRRPADAAARRCIVRRVLSEELLLDAR